MTDAAAASVNVKVEETTRKKPHCRLCGTPMQGHRREPIHGTIVCPSGGQAYAVAPPFPTVEEGDVKPVVRRTPNARRRKSRAKSTPGPELHYQTFTKEDAVWSSRMPGTIAPDNELMHAPPRMATWCQLGFVGFMGGATFFLMFYMLLAFAD
ncbi:uncharacterized protein EV420DRAFT_1639923 [Desarmillaria tabescens]|uniref:Uncharacterized protein n=1 Tax=Armillaria tabescens TaxID=1929756 RepID=A0AA39TWI0_ARMTA|nr:uncharacterized protein EV420DRAFT_1639923 [Desarmillaria tabescens]KAK0461625.1 hypothetical protein EV420DRAFT_1639923 [Desarmillaria tabescens]